MKGLRYEFWRLPWLLREIKKVNLATIWLPGIDFMLKDYILGPSLNQNIQTILKISFYFMKATEVIATNFQLY